MPERSEINLIEAAAGGDIESFGELCRRYYAAMVAVAYTVLADHQLAEDAAQESFARALVRIKSLNDRAKFAPWLAAICRNVAKDMVATRARRIKADDITHTDQNNNDCENIHAIRRAIEQLPAPTKELIVLRYYNNLSYEQIGSVLGISRATINGRILRAKRKMANYLRKNGFPENRL
ncbi:MAG: RNA polymerase sigma factor [Sedimentisphaerales bacterium]|nr:RNA polymerase sigma factor [Sedimentisphaerales bacterium]